ncbi:hypothetical protein OGAPHI_004090 [Ogataea philodendri]|uniref:DNA topoisomerase n=1 Tax=Ogataea philodendri TaxID=1378263 RepID=A0A9P8T5G6_9ASCO|nr:uncharacterized protein OGAPHI_004090 [Ogataea philodendri]KAH3665901.1 hypothetical protein OGAPHI_004090 [Ogataea philodendri]
MKVLCVAEKPAIAKAVAFILGGGRVSTRETKVGWIKNYDFDFDFPQFGSCQVTMTAVTGHITTIDFPENYGWGKCDNASLFTAPLLTKYNGKNSTNIAKNITDEAARSNVLMIWTDCDREGEFIGYEIMEQARKRNPNIGLDTTHRAHFSHLERSHVIHAACNTTRLDSKAIDAVMTRMELDLRTGSSFTRFLTDLFRKSLKLDGVVSYGGCQFPTLGFVVDRYKRIKSFKPEEFWYLNLSIKKKSDRSKTGTSVTWSRGHLFDRLAGLSIYQRCLEMDAEEATVVSVETKPTSNWAPLPLTTVEMQKDCARIFKFSAKQTLAIAEKLYNSGFISYPRTETDRFPRKMELKKLIEKQQQSSSWGQYASSLLNDPTKYRQPREGSHDDKAHPPIHPVIFTSGDSLNMNERKVYEYIVRRFLACCSKDATGLRTSIKLKWGTESFSTSGLVVKELNYLEVYIYNSWESSKTKIPEVNPGEKVTLTSAQLSSGKTSAPSPLTEPELIALMDVNGIGTDATIAEHIEKIIERSYVTKEDQGRGKSKTKVLIPTELGYALAEGFGQIGFDSMSLTKPFLRKNLEVKLKAICDGESSKEQVLHEIGSMYREAYALTSRSPRILTESYQKVLASNA